MLQHRTFIVRLYRIPQTYQVVCRDCGDVGEPFKLHTWATAMAIIHGRHGRITRQCAWVGCPIHDRDNATA